MIFTHTLKYADHYDSMLPHIRVIDVTGGGSLVSKLLPGTKVAFVKSCPDQRDCIVQAEDGRNYRIPRRNMIKY